jgi:CubicO group peptidase (beta-lactamase class C family)
VSAGPPAVSGGASRGTVAPGYEAVREAFDADLAGEERGAAFAAMVDGELVVDLWGGDADAPVDRRWREDTLCILFSGTKGLVATCMLRLLERGAIALDAPVAEYWPEFAANGKEGVLVRHVLGHQAGLPGVREPVSAADVPDWNRITALLAGQAPFWEPGSRLWYHPLTYGWLCGEIVRRVTGMPLGTHLREEIAGPFGLDLWIGLPAELEGRVARSELADTWPGPIGEGAEDRMSAADLDSIWRNPDHFKPDLDWNTPSWRRAEIPGANGFATARAMATHYGILAAGGTVDGRRLLGRETIELGAATLAEGEDPCVGEVLRFGVGWALQTPDCPFGPVEEAFGHGGAGGSIHGAWPEEGVGFSYLPNLMREDADDRRGALLLEALHQVTGSSVAR